MLRSYLQSLYDAIPFSIDRIGDRRDWERWREVTLRALRRALGLERFPPRTPLEPRLLGTLDRGDFLIEKVLFQTRPDFLMTANLYRPKRIEGRVPAVLCVHGHNLRGKTSEAVQTRAINYARAGWFALAVDATGHGERTHIGHRRTFAIITTGLTLEGVQVWDNIRAVDYLLSLPEVDPARIGITGCSGGGNQTMYTAALDQRIAVAVPVCSVSTLRGQIFTPNGIGCQCECVPDLMRYGLENAVVCALIAPRPLLVLASTRDEVFPVRFTRQAHRHLQRFYRAIGYPDRYAYIERRLPHGYQRPFRQLAHAWFDRWFNGRPAMVPWRERGPKPLPAERLWCFPNGDLPEGSSTLGRLAWERARGLAARLEVPPSDAARRRLRHHLRDRVLGGFPRRVPLGIERSRPRTRGGMRRVRITFTTEDDLCLGARLLLPPRPSPRTTPCLVLFRERLSRGGWGPAEELLSRGVALVEFAPRDLTDEHAARAALVLGRPLVGMAAFDLLRLMDCLEEVGPEEGIDGGRIFIWAEGLLTLPALYALALDERPAGAVLVGLLSTYVSPAPVQHPTWTFARDLLRYADIEHLLALVAPRGLVVVNPVDPQGLEPLPAGALRRAFPAARRGYRSSRNLRVIGADRDRLPEAALKVLGIT